MFDTLRATADRWLGRGTAAITVPVMDGMLRPNRVLDQASVVAALPGIDDLASDGRTLWVSAGSVLSRLDGGGLVEARRFDADITALAVAPGGRIALALNGARVQVLAADGKVEAELTALAGKPLCGVNALAWEGDAALLISDGSMRRAPALWCHDLMELGRSGRVARWTPGGSAELLASNLAYAFGVLPTSGGVLVAESWRHRVLKLGPGGAQPLLAELPGYPSRMARAAAGGYWLSCFVCRSQLVEFVLREPEYRRRMMAEIDPRHWIAPALSSGHSFLEPLQGAGVKQMGVLKPWAPPRSYGLVLQVSDDGHVLRSLHSQVDGKHHGITAIAEHDGALYAASKGSGRLLRVDLGSATGRGV
jgi:hypothetical protein